MMNNIGIWQVVVVILLGVLLTGDIKSKVKDIKAGWKEWRDDSNK